MDRDLLQIGSILTGDLPDLGEAEWKRVARRAIEERLGPLLFAHTRHSHSIPKPVTRELRSAYYNTSALNLLIYRELERFVKRSGRLGLSPPIVLKGAALASSWYESIALRPMCDLDLLVPREELRRYLEAANELGYRRDSPEMVPGLAAATHFEVAVRGGPGDGVLVEFHWSLVGGESDSRAPDLGWFFEQTESFRPPEELADETRSIARQLEPTALLLYLCAHATLQHGESSARAIWFYDLHEIVDKRPLQIRWEHLVDRAHSFGWSGGVLRALERSRELFGTRLPEEALVSLAGNASTEERSVAHLRVKRAPRGRAEWVWAEMACLTPLSRLKLALAILFPSPTYLKWRYPTARRFWPFCYPYRISVVLGEAVGALWRAVLTARVARRSTSC